MYKDEPTDTHVGRRTFMKAAGVATGAGLVGASASSTAAATDDLDERFLNWRKVEAQKVWDRGYRGRTDRSLALADSGIAARHPDLGPWNGVLADVRGDQLVTKQQTGTKTVEKPKAEVGDPIPGTEFTFSKSSRPFASFGAAVYYPDYTGSFTIPDAADGEGAPRTTRTTLATGTRSGTIGTGNFVTGTAREETEPFTPAEMETDAPGTTDELYGEATWDPGQQDNELHLERRTDDGGWTQVASSENPQPPAQPETIRYGDADPTATYRWVVETYTNVEADYEVSFRTVDVETTSEPIDTDESVVSQRISATITWNTDTPGPQATSINMELQENVAGNWRTREQTGGGTTELRDSNQRSLTFETEEGGEFRFRVNVIRGGGEWTIEGRGETIVEKTDEDGNVITTTTEVPVFEDVDDPMAVEADGAGDTKTVGWFNAPGNRYDTAKARDPDGHGSHCAGIMAASGRASVVDEDNTTVYRPRAVLAPGDVVEYDVAVPATGTVFASAFGENARVEIVYDDEVVHTAGLRFDSIIADEPAVHESGTETYTVRVRPAETTATAVYPPVVDESVVVEETGGTPTACRLRKIAVGTYRDPTGTTGGRAENDEQAVHSGLAPNQSLVGLQGLGPAPDYLSRTPQQFADAFNLRALNMSFGYPAGAPFGSLGEGFGTRLASQLKDITEAGILGVAAAGNAPSPANGNGMPNGADEVISVVATGPLDGITSYSAGGIATRDEDEGDLDRKPEVTAPGGDLKPDALQALTGVYAPIPSYYEFIRSVGAPSPDASFDEGDPPRDFLSIPGTSMASPYVCGMSALVAQAMEEDAPDRISLPVPSDTGFEDVMRLKQVILATASETAFTAAPYHNGKTTPHPATYQFGERDPYEGYGRVNPDAAVDAVTRELVDPSAPAPGETVTTTREESVGLYVPEHSRAVAGYVHAEGGSFEASVDFTRYSGGNRGMATGDPHLDLFVYDAATPAANGSPNVVARAQGRQGSASVSVPVPEDGGTYMIVAKIVNVPGAVNGFDVKAHFDLSTRYTAPELPVLSAGGARRDDGDAFTAGQTNQVEVTVTDISGEVPDAAEVRIVDRCPWDVDTEYGDAVGRTDDDAVDLGTTTAGAVRDGGVTRAYFAEAPEATGRYEFGSAEVRIDAVEGLAGTSASFGGTDTNTVVGADTET